MQKTKKKKIKSLLFCFIFILMTFFNMMQVTKVQSFNILEKKYTSPKNSDNSDNIFNLINSGSLTSQKQRILHNILEPNNLKINLGGFSTNLYLQWQDFQYICDYWSAMAPGWIDSRYQYKWLKGNGIKLSGTFFPMASNSPLEFYYNESFRSTRFAQMNSDLGDVTWIDFLSRITLGDEVPASSFNWCSFFSPSDQWPSDVIKYNQTYHDETGFWMKGLDVMNRSESFCFQNWIENRTATAMNLCYDWFKNKNSNWEVGWNTMAWPGLEPLLIKSDWRISGCYDTRFRDIYSQLRYYDVNFPNDKLIGLSWGNPYWEGGKDLVGDDLESNFWAGYFAGADELIQFHYNWLNWDELSIKTWERLKKLYHTARSMPIWNASPTILELSDERGLPKPEAAGLVEYDVTTQLILNNTNFDLSKYRVIVIRDQMNIWDGIVEKLNQFVRTGGSIILVGRSLGWLNEYGEQRNNLFEFEQAGGGYNIAYEEYYSPFTLSFNGTNQLDFEESPRNL